MIGKIFEHDGKRGNGELITISLMCRRFVFPEGGGLCLHDATVVHRRGSPPEFFNVKITRCNQMLSAAIMTYLHSNLLAPSTVEITSIRPSHLFHSSVSPKIHPPLPSSNLRVSDINVILIIPFFFSKVQLKDSLISQILIISLNYWNRVEREREIIYYRGELKNWITESFLFYM